MAYPNARQPIYSILIATYPHYTRPDSGQKGDQSPQSRLGDISVDWVDFVRDKGDTGAHPDHCTSAAQVKEVEMLANKSIPGASTADARRRTVPGSSGSQHVQSRASTSTHPRRKAPSASDLSLQPLLAHLPGSTSLHNHEPRPLDASVASGVTQVGRGVVHLFKHAPPASLIASLDAHPVGEGSRSADPRKASLAKGSGAAQGPDYAGQHAEGEDGSLVAILAVPAWMRPADFLEFIGGWGTCLEGVRMIRQVFTIPRLIIWKVIVLTSREATTPNRSIVLLKFRDGLQASDFMVVFTARPFSTLDPRETCHPIRIHHLVLHQAETPCAQTSAPVAVPAFPPSTYSSRAAALAELLPGIESPVELPTCPVCLERLDSSVTGLVTLPCAHTFDCDCLKKWGDSRCPVCRVSHLLLSAQGHGRNGASEVRASASTTGVQSRNEVTRLTRCQVCDATEGNWICVVCGAVGCGRYDKGHARRHWEESGHVLAMELDTQRVWDYKGDNYVHRLIQTRTDGKLVELPSASSLITPSHPHIPRALPFGRSAALSSQSISHTPRTSIDSNPSALGDVDTPRGTGDAGPSTNDVEKMSTIEAITLEYSYLLSSQLEAMRQHYDGMLSSTHASSSALSSEIADLNTRLQTAEATATAAQTERDKAVKRADKAGELSRELHRTLQVEKALNEGLSQKVKSLSEKVDAEQKGRAEMEDRVTGLEETVRDLMFALEAGAKIKQAGGEDDGVGGDLMVRLTGAKGKKGRK